jgi:hypothetical protein
MKPETFLLYPMIRILWSLLAICLAANNLSAQGTKEDAKIRFSITRFDPMDRPAPEFMVKNGAKETPVKVPLTYIAGPFSATLRDDKYLDFFEPGAKVPVLSTVVPPELQKDLLLVFIPVKETFEILKIHTPPSSIQGGDHYVINATATDVAIKFGTAAPVVISPKKATLLHDPAAGKSPTLPVIIQQKDGDKWKPVTTENWPHDVRFRTFLFLYTSLRDHHMAFHGITERVD